ncbi:uncharacterized protein LOC143040795 [Oratosquilla oratoria]|uniref:uncharacterized protein LOC143040795 n=1 Tax=Oratosquilla oratoria TaxID=337810 RepID=UPI003F758C6B
MCQKSSQRFHHSFCAQTDDFPQELKMTSLSFLKAESSVLSRALNFILQGRVNHAKFLAHAELGVNLIESTSEDKQAATTKIVGSLKSNNTCRSPTLGDTNALSELRRNRSIVFLTFLTVAFAGPQGYNYNAPSGAGPGFGGAGGRPTVGGGRPGAGAGSSGIGVGGFGAGPAATIGNVGAGFGTGAAGLGAGSGAGGFGSASSSGATFGGAASGPGGVRGSGAPGFSAGAGAGAFQGGRPSGPVVPILRDDREGPTAEGFYSFSYESGDGTIRQEQGAPQGPAGAVASQGSWSFTFPDGTPAEFQFVADEGGYRVESPLLPTPPPLPAHAIAQIEKAAQEAASGAGGFGGFGTASGTGPTGSLGSGFGAGGAGAGNFGTGVGGAGAGAGAGAGSFGPGSGAGGFGSGTGPGGFGSGTESGTSGTVGFGPGTGSFGTGTGSSTGTGFSSGTGSFGIGASGPGGGIGATGTGAPAAPNMSKEFHASLLSIPSLMCSKLQTLPSLPPTPKNTMPSNTTKNGHQSSMPSSNNTSPQHHGPEVKPELPPLILCSD